MSTLTLSDQQAKAAAQVREAINGSCRDPFVLDGLAGTGKTTVLSRIAREYPQAILCTLTGKAASILRRKTQLPACTVHTAFYRLEEVARDKRGRRDLTFKAARDDGSLDSGMVLIDECSMISHEIAADILRTGAKVIACGDPGQLPPVSGKPFFDKANVSLTDIHRQALESPIIRQAHAVRAGRCYEPDGEAFRVVAREAQDADVIAADVILCFTNRTRLAANNYARRVRGFWQPTPQIGEPVVCLKNAADYGLFNGAVYSLEAPFREGDSEIHLNIDGVLSSIPLVRFAGVKSGLKEGVEETTSFDFGYAMTVHKAQGSEWPAVLLMDEYNRAEHRKEWLYTAITRAAERIVVVR
jgi:exodeoxyribonuclease-5